MLFYVLCKQISKPGMLISGIITVYAVNYYLNIYYCVTFLVTQINDEWSDQAFPDMLASGTRYTI